MPAVVCLCTLLTLPRSPSLSLVLYTHIHTHSHRYTFKKRAPSKFNFVAEARSMIERSNRPISSCDVYMYAKGDRGQTTEGNQMRVKIPYVNQVRTSAMLCCCLLLLLELECRCFACMHTPCFASAHTLRLLHPHPLLTTPPLLSHATRDHRMCPWWLSSVPWAL